MADNWNPPCALCARKKIKCDRIVPCSYCLKNGLEKECKQPQQPDTFNGLVDQDRVEAYEVYILNIMHLWDHWVIQQGWCSGLLLPTKVYGIHGSEENWHGATIKMFDEDECKKLLDYSMENLGCLYFSFFPDISELYQMLSSIDTYFTDTGTVDFLLNEALLWSILTMTMHYVDKQSLEKIHLPEHVNAENQEEIYGELLAYTLEMIQKIMHYPDIRVIQIFLILNNTPLRTQYPLFYNHFATTCLQLSQVLNLNTCFKTGAKNSVTSSLISNISDKMWYKLLYWDYKTESSNRPISLHSTMFPSLLKHAAYLNSLNPERYTSEDSLELLQWKIVSLERDMDQYYTKKPLLKTLEVIKRELDILQAKFSHYERLETPQSNNDKFDRFIITLSFYAVYWKLLKLIVIFFYQDVYSLNELFQYSRILLNVLENNENYLKHPMVTPIIAHLGSFHGFFYIFNKHQENHKLFKAVRELLKKPQFAKDHKCEQLLSLFARFSKFKNMFNMRDLNTIEKTDSAAILILKNDIKIMTNQFTNRIPNIVNDVGPVLDTSIKEEPSLSPEMKAFVRREEDNIFQILASFKDFI